MMLSFPVNLEGILHPRSSMCLTEMKLPMLYMRKKYAEADKHKVLGKNTKYSNRAEILKKEKGTKPMSDKYILTVNLL